MLEISQWAIPILRIDCARMLESSSRAALIPNIALALRADFVLVIRSTDFAHGLRADACNWLLKSVDANTNSALRADLFFLFYCG